MRFEKLQAVGNAYLVMEGGRPAPAHAPTPMSSASATPTSGAGSDGILVILTVAAGPRTGADPTTPTAGRPSSRATAAASRLATCAGRDGTAEVAIETLKGSIARHGRRQVGHHRRRPAALAGWIRPCARRRPAPGAGLHVRQRRQSALCDRGRRRRRARPGALGPPIEHHAWFPNRANVEFYRPLGPNDIRMRVWERGAGETLSSGSGSTAAAVAAVTAGDGPSPVTVHTDGGDAGDRDRRRS